MGDTTSGEFRCHATLLFADLCDYTSLTEAIDPEEVAQLLKRVRAQVDAVVHKHRGTVNEWRGDGVLCIFGIPLATEEDPRHALEAALEMHEVVRALDAESAPAGFELRLHTGVDAGLVFARRRGEADGYDLVGDAVNTAARLCSHASRDEIWVSQAALESFKERFETQGLVSLSLKGKKDSVRACRVLGRSDVTSRFGASQRRGLTPLVGREAVLGDLLQELGPQREPGLRFTSVVGAAGMGKTRLLDELKQRAPTSINVLHGCCESGPNAVPLQPFVAILRRSFGVGDGIDAEAAGARVDAVLAELDGALLSRRDLLLHLIGHGPLQSGGAAPELVQRALVELALQVFERLSRRGTTLLLLDDWQWADDMSRQMLGGILRGLAQTHVTVVLASREPSDPLMATGKTVALEPFSQEEAARVIAALLPYSLNLGLTQTIHDRTGGNPLFLEELCRVLPNQASSGQEDLDGSRVPSTLRGILQTRIERLPARPARVLEAAAVIGGVASSAQLSRLVDAPDLSDSLRILTESDLLHPTLTAGVYRFKHATTRQVVYESVRLSERRRLHGKLADGLEALALDNERPPFEELAHHLAGSGNHGRAAQFAELAGDRASASSSLDHARQHYRAALTALDKLIHDAEHERRWIAIVDKWAAASLYSPAEEHLTLIRRAGEMASRLEDLPAAARAEYWLGWFYYALGDQPRATQYCRSALARAEAAGDERLAGQLVLSLGQSLAAACSYEEALSLLSAGLGAKRRAFRASEGTGRSGRTPLAYAYALACKGLVHGDVGQFADAYACFDEALSALRGSDHAVEGSCLGLLGMVQIFQGKWREALDTAERARATAERVNGPYVFAMSRTVSGYARWMLERNPAAIAELIQAVTWMEARGIRLFISFNYAFLADALASAGEVEQALDYAERALARVEQSDRLGEAMAHRVWARILRKERRDPEAARAHLEYAMTSAYARSSKRELAMSQLAWAELHAELGAREPAAQAQATARQLFEELGMEHHARAAST